MDANTYIALGIVLSALQKETLSYPNLQSYIFQALAEVSKRQAHKKLAEKDSVLFGVLIEVRMCICELACQTNLPGGVWKWYGWMERIVERMGAYLHAGDAKSLSELLVVFFSEV